MKIELTEVFGLERSMAAASLPKLEKPDGPLKSPKAIFNLSRSTPGSGHDCFLKGISVSSRVTADHSFWLQWQRYHFHDIVSSTSKMHKILTMDYAFEEGTDKTIISLWEKVREECKEDLTPENHQRLIMSTPIGLMLTAETVTNYLQLKTVHRQRRNHRMKAWHVYCAWIEELPLFKDLVLDAG